MLFIRSGRICKMFTSLACFTRPRDFIRSGRLCIISASLAWFTRPVWITWLVDFIWSYRIADFAQHLSALQKISRRVDLIRLGCLCIISISLTEITVLGRFIMSGLLCIISTSLAKTIGLVGFITSGRLSILMIGLIKITQLLHFIMSCRLCTVSSSLTKIYHTSEIYQPCGRKKGLASYVQYSLAFRNMPPMWTL